MSARRTPLSWSIERSRIQADRDARVALTLKWEEDHSTPYIRHVAFDADGRRCGDVILLGADFISRILLPSLDVVRVATFSRRTGCSALRNAKAAVEAALASSGQQQAA